MDICSIVSHIVESQIVVVLARAVIVALYSNLVAFVTISPNSEVTTYTSEDSIFGFGAMENECVSFGCTT